MKLLYTLLMVTMLLCSIGIVSAANDVDMSKMVDMEKVKTNAMSFWSDIADVGYLVLGSALTVCLLIIFGVAVSGAGNSALGGKGRDANATNEGRKSMADAVYAIVGLVVVLLVIAVVARML